MDSVHSTDKGKKDHFIGYLYFQETKPIMTLIARCNRRKGIYKIQYNNYSNYDPKKGYR